MRDLLNHRVLYSLFCLSRDTQHISAVTLAAAAGTTPTRAATALIELERQGLCDASRARLTMLGLAAAARVTKAGGGTLRARPVPVAAPVEPSLSIAAQPSVYEQSSL